MTLRPWQDVGHHEKRSYESGDSNMKETSPQSLETGGGAERARCWSQIIRENCSLGLIEDGQCSMVKVVRG